MRDALSDTDLVRAKELADAAIDAPWVAVRAEPDRADLVVLDANGMWVAKVGNDPGSAQFIAAARTLVPALVAEVERLRALGPLLAAWRAQVEADIADGFAPSDADQALLEWVRSEVRR